MILELRLFDDPIKVTGIGSLDEVILQLDAMEPKKKRSAEHSIWKRDYNLVVDAVNKIAGYKRYTSKK